MNALCVTQRSGFREIYRQELTIILFHSCTDSSNVLCLSLLKLEEHFGSDILDKNLLGGAKTERSACAMVMLGPRFA